MVKGNSGGRGVFSEQIATYSSNRVIRTNDIRINVRI